MIDHNKLAEKWRILASVGPKTKGPRKENPLMKPPDWYDPVRFRKSQEISRKYFLSLNIAHFIGNILLVHLPDVLVPVVASGNSASPSRVFFRILSTINHILSWYDDDPFDSRTKTHQSLTRVRRNCHMAVSKLMNEKYPRKNRLWLSQFDMAMTQWSLIGIVAIRPIECGFHGCTREEFEEFFYFWKVMGHCVGLEDRFNICYGLDGFDETKEFLQICFDKCYKVHLDEQSVPVLIGMDLTKGVFLALESVIPRILFSFEGFMKIWYDTLGVRHSIVLDRWLTKISYESNRFVFKYLLRFRLIYTIISWLFFWSIQMLFKQKQYIDAYCERNYPTIKYSVDSEYFNRIDNDSSMIDDDHLDGDDRESKPPNHSKSIDSNRSKIIEHIGTETKQIYEIQNYFYIPHF
ncbi:hypothetical protein QR98_0032900 [Sarcoptes scabiei]|uniref:Uncharacterized protein n=1 Tax=Sarcoptes scabiei TaxID=52283 RepID=A0A132A194_SARSC|nr:hypothetical protein QR98_0032900 [Sarcoptes scabiei]